MLPGGLPSLRSLGIEQRASKRPDLPAPGALWHAEKRTAERNFDVLYMTFLAQGVPNLEELELMGECGSSPVRRFILFGHRYWRLKPDVS